MGCIFEVEMSIRVSLYLRSLTLTDSLRTCQRSTSASITSSACLSSPIASNTLSGVVTSSAPLHNIPARPFHAASSRLDFRLDPILFAEPLKKKRKIDPAVLKRREDRIRGKIQRALDRLGRFAEKLKPVDEFEIPRALLKERDARTRVLEPLSFEESEKRAKLKRQHSELSLLAYELDRNQIWRVQESQRRALAELKAESEELYLKAIEIDEGLMGMVSPIVTATPPIAGYEAPDGEHTDVTKTFEYDVDFMTVLEANLSHNKPKWQLKKEAKEAAALLQDDADDDKKDKKKTQKKQVNNERPPLNPY